jgi:hypothetical protein
MRKNWRPSPRNRSISAPARLRRIDGKLRSAHREELASDGFCRQRPVTFDPLPTFAADLTALKLPVGSAHTHHLAAPAAKSAQGRAALKAIEALRSPLDLQAHHHGSLACKPSAGIPSGWPRKELAFRSDTPITLCGL